MSTVRLKLRVHCGYSDVSELSDTVCTHLIPKVKKKRCFLLPNHIYKEVKGSSQEHWSWIGYRSLIKDTSEGLIFAAL